MSFSVCQLNGFDIHRTTTVPNIRNGAFCVLWSLVVVVVVMVRVWFFLLPLLPGKQWTTFGFGCCCHRSLHPIGAPSQRACNSAFAYRFGDTANIVKTHSIRKNERNICYFAISIKSTRFALYALFNRHNLRNDYNLKMTYQTFSSWTSACVNNV